MADIPLDAQRSTHTSEEKDDAIVSCTTKQNTSQDDYGAVAKQHGSQDDFRAEDEVYMSNEKADQAPSALPKEDVLDVLPYESELARIVEELIRTLFQRYSPAQSSPMATVPAEVTLSAFMAGLRAVFIWGHNGKQLPPAGTWHGWAYGRSEGAPKLRQERQFLQLLYAYIEQAVEDRRTRLVSRSLSVMELYAAGWTTGIPLYRQLFRHEISSGLMARVGPYKPRALALCMCRIRHQTIKTKVGVAVRDALRVTALEKSGFEVITVADNRHEFSNNPASGFCLANFDRREFIDRFRPYGLYYGPISRLFLDWFMTPDAWAETRSLRSGAFFSMNLPALFRDFGLEEAWIPHTDVTARQVESASQALAAEGLEVCPVADAFANPLVAATAKAEADRSWPQHETACNANQLTRLRGGSPFLLIKRRAKVQQA